MDSVCAEWTDPSRKRDPLEFPPKHFRFVLFATKFRQLFFVVTNQVKLFVP